jgi:hypothetical protein
MAGGHLITLDSSRPSWLTKAELTGLNPRHVWIGSRCEAPVLVRGSTDLDKYFPSDQTSANRCVADILKIHPIHLVTEQPSARRAVVVHTSRPEADQEEGYGRA